jgi:hypothetical protein
MATNVTPVPSLTVGGWIVTPQQKADLLMAYFYESMNNQTYVFQGQITSIQYLIEQNAGSMPKTCDGIRTALETYLGRYYQSVIVQVTSDDVTSGNQSSEITLTIYISVTEAGQVYGFTQLISMADSKFLKAVTINNDGSASNNSILQQMTQ